MNAATRHRPPGTVEGAVCAGRPTAEPQRGNVFLADAPPSQVGPAGERAAREASGIEASVLELEPAPMAVGGSI